MFINAVQIIVNNWFGNQNTFNLFAIAHGYSASAASKPFDWTNAKHAQEFAFPIPVAK